MKKLLCLSFFLALFFAMSEEDAFAQGVASPAVRTKCSGASFFTLEGALCHTRARREEILGEVAHFEKMAANYAGYAETHESVSVALSADAQPYAARNHFWRAYQYREAERRYRTLIGPARRELLRLEEHIDFLKKIPSQNESPLARGGRLG